MNSSPLTRRTFLNSVGVLTGGTLLLDSTQAQAATAVNRAGLTSTAAENAWPEFQGGPKNIGANTESTPLKDPVEVKWKGATSGAITTAIAVQDGTLYVGSYDGNLYAFDTETGEEEWRHEVAGRATGGVSVHGTQVYVGDDQGKLYALTTDGAVKWTYQSPDDSISASITTTSEYITFIGSVDSGIHSHFHALNHDGEEIFTTNGTGFSDYDSWTFHSVPPTIDGDLAYIPTGSGIVELDIENQEINWTGAYANTAPSLVNRSLVAASYGDISSSNTSNGGSNWSTGIPDEEIYFAHGDSPAVVDRTVITAVGSRDNDKGYVYGHDLVTGDRQWETKIQTDLSSAPVTDGTYAYIGDHSGTIHALSVESGSKAWTVEAGNGVYSQLAIVNGVLYVGDRDGYVYAIHNAPPNDPPEPRFEIAPSEPQVGELVQFDASASTDDKTIETYEWHFDGNNVADATGSLVERQFSVSGEHTIKLVVEDDDGATKPLTKTVTVRERTSTSTSTSSRTTSDSTTTSTEISTTGPTGEQSASEAGLFSAGRGFLTSGDGLLINKLSAWMLSVIGFSVSLAGVVYTMLKE